MDVFTFDSHDDMTKYLTKIRQAAKEGLHPEQARLTYGDHWVEFVDVGARIVIFGRVHTLDEVRDSEHPDYVDDIVATTETDLVDGMMYGRAYSRLEPFGELGYTHKANAWPIEGRLFDAAKAAEWDIDALDEAGKVLLQIAYAAWRAHRMAVTE